MCEIKTIDALFYKKLGNELFKARKKNNLIQEQVAKKIGVTRQTIDYYELGKVKIKQERLKELCSIYGIKEKIDIKLKIG